MFGTTSKNLSTPAMGCQTMKTKKNGVSRHHGQTLVNPTIRGDLLRPAVKGFNCDDYPTFPNSSFSSKLFLSLPPPIFALCLSLSFP